MRHMTRICGLAVIYIGVITTAIYAEDDSTFLDRVKKDYKFDKWAGSTRENYVKGVTVQEGIRPADLIGGAEVQVLAENTSDYGNVRGNRYMLATTHNGNRVEIYLRVSWGRNPEEVHAAMIHFLADCAAPTLRRDTDVDMTVGDVCFVGWGKTVSSLAFCRNNVFVHIAATNVDYDVSTIARKMDSSLVAASQGKMPVPSASSHTSESQPAAHERNTQNVPDVPTTVGSEIDSHSLGNGYARSLHGTGEDNQDTASVLNKNDMPGRWWWVSASAAAVLMLIGSIICLGVRRGRRHRCGGSPTECGRK